MTVYSDRAPGVYLEEVAGIPPISGVGTALAAFLGLAAQGPTQPTLVANWSQFSETYGGITEGMALGPSVYAYLANGGGNCLVVRVGGGEDTGAQTASATLLATDGSDALVITANDPGDRGNQVSIEVSTPSGTETSDDAADDEDADDAGAAAPKAGGATFDVVVQGPGKQRESFTGLTAQSALSRLRTSRLVTATTPSGGPVVHPADGTTTLSGGATGEAVSAGNFLGDAEELTGLAGLVPQDEVTMVAAPDLVSLHRSGAMAIDDVSAVQGAIIDHCSELGDRMAIIDPPFAADGSGGSMSAQEVSTWRDGLTGSKFATVYYPWVRSYDAVTRTAVALPPSGFVAGAWARNDEENGVGHAPVGAVRGVVGLVRQLTDAEQGPLNRRGINCLRVFRGEGVRIWGARTLELTDTEWRYVNVRRLFNFIEESVVEGTRFAVFEPNDRGLWARLRRAVEAFLLGLWREGALVGAVPEQAFYVKCDDETNPPDRIDQGIVTVEIGAAPAKPAEFVVIRVRQTRDGSSVTE